MKKVHHALIENELTKLRDKSSSSSQFRMALSQITSLLFFEVTKESPLEEIVVKTPFTKTKGYKLKNEIVLVPIMRAGLGMVDPIVRYSEKIRVGHLGIYREHEGTNVISYYKKMPENIGNSHVIILDPMLATGTTLATAISSIKKNHPIKISVVAIVAAPEGIKAVEAAHPDVDIYLAAIDEKLNKDNYIIPGLGDAGDRLFGTK
ncbi:uracil phosphoribosyltransferase [Mycoplasmoides pneumoniae 19294]|nr:uracil phosphoribosyltransferase [Mycoplasmoides pneumoniae M129-B7]ALA31259.1 uracil phosphoribosyltransferase [Mycoplasmoides pneumoniae 19294]ALA32659.1 uracil phosphoribosyltransferase [Mycoplasmoides pneumoniae 51494]ALA33361.1 uracil phosphoribosyltransferase [Mycoplasmoides pneumoniae 54089]ALA34064.1 uracil phosphoribosyltransferase [Mycoplasmoides pneumoniae 54524]ALA35485.1 uracil phosphoribosyltransferase [Mycoplasmoides pneumoniae 85138]